MGTAEAANRGIDAARSEIIVRLDADDVCEPGRFAQLYAALAEDPELGLVGSAVIMIDEAGRVVQSQLMPETDLEIRFTLLFFNPFYHSTVVFRRPCFEAAGRYIASELISQDHYMWASLLGLCRARNLSAPLARYRLNPQGLSASFSTNWRARTHAIRERAWSAIGLTYDLYDNARAGDIARFLRGNSIEQVERRGPAYDIILEALDAFLATPRAFARPADAVIGLQLKSDLLARMAAAPPAASRFATRCHRSP